MITRQQGMQGLGANPWGMTWGAWVGREGQAGALRAGLHQDTLLQGPPAPLPSPPGVKQTPPTSGVQGLAPVMVGASGPRSGPKQGGLLGWFLEVLIGPRGLLCCVWV